MSEYVFLNQGRYPFSRYRKLKSTMGLKYVSFTKSNGVTSIVLLWTLQPMTKQNMSFLNIEEDAIGVKNENMWA